MTSKHKHILPTGLSYHCDDCNLVIPSDAPKLPDGECAFVEKHKLAWFNPDAVTLHKHRQAVATWTLIHQPTLQAKTCADATEYRHGFVYDNRNHFIRSAIRQGMSDAQVELEKHRHNGSHLHYYDDDGYRERLARQNADRPPQTMPQDNLSTASR